MKRASYREAIRWIAHNEDPEWLNDEEPIPPISALLIVDLFDVEQTRVIADIRRELGKMGR